MARAKKISNAVCEEYLRGKWRSILSKRLSAIMSSHESVVSLLIEDAIDRLASLYHLFGNCKDSHFNKEIMGDDATYTQRMSEILFYYHLRRSGFEDLESKKRGPDFYCKKNGRGYYFEVVTPTPTSKHLEWIQDGRQSRCDSSEMFRERRLHIASAIGRKVDDYDRYLKKGVISAEYNYIVVMNDTFLHPASEPWFGVNLSQPLGIGHAAVAVIANVTLGAMDLRFDDVDGLFLHGEDDVKFTKESRYVSTDILKINGVVGDQPSITLMRGSTVFSAAGGEVDVALLETRGVSGYYQLTLREDLVFMDIVSGYSGHGIFNPSSALAVKANSAVEVAKDIPHVHLYGDDLSFSQVHDPFVILGRKGSELFSAGLKPSLDHIGSRLDGLIFIIACWLEIQRVALLTVER